MNIVQAINKRKSRRTYSSEPIAQDKVALLRSRAEEYNLRSGLTIRFMERGGEAFFQALKSYGFFKGVSSLFILKGPAQDPYLKEKAGYYGELLYNEVEKFDYMEFNKVLDTFSNHSTTIINYFEERLTNASAESFNATIKAFRSQLRGVANVKFFMFRLARLYA